MKDIKDRKACTGGTETNETPDAYLSRDITAESVIHRAADMEEYYLNKYGDKYLNAPKCTRCGALLLFYLDEWTGEIKRRESVCEECEKLLREDRLR